jgi:acetyl-CoA carboxylase biotin carboxyl carrier protein
MDLSHAEVAEILRLIDEGGFEELHLETDTLTLHVSRRRGDAVEQPETAHTIEQRPPPGATPLEAPPATDEHRVAIKAPLLGTFYRAPSPGAPPFVEPGGLVAPDTTVGIVEVMKLMHAVAAGVSGRIVQVCAENGSLVEYDQTLFLVDPAAM